MRLAERFARAYRPNLTASPLPAPPIMIRIPVLLASAALLLLAPGCIPYSTGTTATTVPPGAVTGNTAVYFVPGGIEELTTDSTRGSIIGFDLEWRMGIGEHADLGIRAPGLVGVAVDYKRRVAGLHDADAPGLALMAGGGVVNAGDHALFSAAVLASGRNSDRLTPYGGFKAMHVLPLREEAVSDDPTLGVFAGARIGTELLGISPEIAVFYDRSALNLRDHNIIVVPSFTFHGNQLLEAILGRPGSRRPPLPPGPRRWR
jgi:hypothetical protein